MGGERPHLVLAGGVVAVVVEAGLADGDHLRPARLLLGEPTVEPRGAVGVEPDDLEHLIVLGGQPPHGRDGVAISAHCGELGHARGPRPLDQPAGVGLARVEVTMGVDHYAAAAGSTLGKSWPSSPSVAPPTPLPNFAASTERSSAPSASSSRSAAVGTNGHSSSETTRRPSATPSS